MQLALHPIHPLFSHQTFIGHRPLGGKHLLPAHVMFIAHWIVSSHRSLYNALAPLESKQEAHSQPEVYNMVEVTMMLSLFRGVELRREVRWLEQASQGKVQW